MVAWLGPHRSALSASVPSSEKASGLSSLKQPCIPLYHITLIYFLHTLSLLENVHLLVYMFLVCLSPLEHQLHEARGQILLLYLQHLG